MPLMLPRPTLTLLQSLVVHGVLAGSASASNIVVNSKADIVADDGLCTLREAVIAANTNLASGNTPGECAAGEPTNPVTDLPIDQILFVNVPGSPDIYQLDITGADDVAQTGDLDILESVYVLGNGAAETIIQGIQHSGFQERVFSINTTQFSITVLMQGVTIQFGHDQEAGGGIYNFVGNLFVSDSAITHNHSHAGRGGIANISGGFLTLINSEVSLNTARQGGGVYNDENSSSISVTGSQFLNNVASCHLGGCVAAGGGIFTHFGSVTLTGSHFQGNQASCLADPCESRRGGLYADHSMVQILGGDLHMNAAHCGQTLHCQLLGAGVFNTGGSVLIEDATLSNNQARCDTTDQCESPRAGLIEARGGGIFNAGTLTVRRATLSNNHAVGGGLAFGGGLANVGRATVVNSTVSGNLSSCVAGNSYLSWGGGLLSFNAAGSADIRFSTFAENEVKQKGSGGILRGGGIAAPSGAFLIRSSIVAKNSTDNCFIGSGPGTGANLDDDGTCAGFTLSNINPHIGPLAMNGGPTETHRLLPSSPAIDAASSCNGITTDQRGTARPQSSACDLGSYERLSVGAATPGLQQLLETIVGVRNAALRERLLAPLGEIPRLISDRQPRNDGAACGKLDAFIRQVTSAVPRGELTRDEAAELTRLALSVQRELGCAR